MRVAFVGVKRKYQELPPDYRELFTQYHLELPWYFAKEGHNSVVVTTVDYDSKNINFSHDAMLDHTTEQRFMQDERFACVDVVVHWRKWFPELYRPEAINVINCQDHSFSQEWKKDVYEAFVDGKLYGVLCFPTWHKENLWHETVMTKDRLIDCLTLGVDTDIYTPDENKDPYELLWASDPGRGLEQCLQMFFQLYRLDNRFRLNVCWPDYCNFKPSFQHPGIIWHGNVPNGPRLWKLFNSCGVLPYTSTFMEPSSRAHRQAQAAGSLVLYPPGRGSPSELIQGDLTGVVAPVEEWPRRILHLVNSGRWKDIGNNARNYAVSENWAVQARRFNTYFEKLLGERK